jgi:hypothetical protein
LSADRTLGQGGGGPIATFEKRVFLTSCKLAYSERVFAVFQNRAAPMRAGLAQPQLSFEAGLSRPYISQLEVAGGRHPVSDL